MRLLFDDERSQSSRTNVIVYSNVSYVLVSFATKYTLR